ncbi:MAG: hypothetical protein A2V79_01175 [Betaproteobacteria bacterium RBG_16_56_24]|nr:MAG: hypothetical protein A2V79_01175 [Betaproteobacteria bacterium RBG_16_56_24]
MTPFAVGAAHISRTRFFTLNLIGAIVWTISFGYAGYLFGEAFRLFLEDFKRYEIYVLVALVVAGFLFWLINLIRRRRRALEHKK